MRILHDQVGTLDRTSDLRTPCHQIAEGGILQCHDKTPYAVNTHEEIHVVRVIFYKTLAILDRHFNLIIDLFISVVNLGFIHQGILRFIARRPEDQVRTLIDEGHKSLNQVIDKTILIQVIRLIHADVQNMRRLDVTVLTARDILRIHAKMTHAVRRNLLCQRYRNNLFLRRNITPRLLYNDVNVIQHILDGRQPCLIDHLMHDLMILLQDV